MEVIILDYVVTIDKFEGPLDLLLHLLRQSKIEISDIKVSVIAKQYVNYIKQMENMNLEVASEYLEMAATLIYLKSKKLLPLAKLSFNDDPEDTSINSEEELKRRLMEYERHKNTVEDFRTLEEIRSNQYSKLATELPLPENYKPILEKNRDVYDLLSAFNKMLRRYKIAKPVTTTIKPSKYTIEERIDKLAKQIETKDNYTFEELFLEDKSREYLVVTFFAILELAKQQLIIIDQDENFETIHIKRYIKSDTEELVVDFSNIGDV